MNGLTKKHFLYMSDFNKKGFVEQYLSDTLQKEFKINNIYTHILEIKTILINFLFGVIIN